MTVAVFPDTSDVDDAIIQFLQADPELQTLMPDGVVWDLALQDATAFIVISQIHHLDTHVQGSLVPAVEQIRYLVKAVHQSTSGLTVKEAARRIRTLLSGAALEVPGYGVMRIDRAERVRYTELDQQTLARWQHRGGQYDVWVTPWP